jgi:hypothetical protein
MQKLMQNEYFKIRKGMVKQYIPSDNASSTWLGIMGMIWVFGKYRPNLFAAREHQGSTCSEAACGRGGEDPRNP